MKSNILIEATSLDIAKDVCNSIDIPEIRNRAVANVLASIISEKFFENISIDTNSGIHDIIEILNRIDIADIYINDCYIDVRLYFDENEICVPKSHFDNNHTPVAYMFIKVDEDISSAEVTGFILPDMVNTDKDYNDYYRISEDSLISFYDVEPFLIPEDSDITDIDIEKIAFKFLDGELTKEDSNDYIRLLLKSKDARFFLKKAAKAKTLLKYISIDSNNCFANVDIEPDNNFVKDADSDLLLEEELSDDIDLNHQIDNIEPLETLNIDNKDNIELVLDIDTEDSTIDMIGAEVPQEDITLLDNNSGDVFDLEEESDTTTDLVEHLDSYDVNKNLNKIDNYDNLIENSNDIIEDFDIEDNNQIEDINTESFENEVEDIEPESNTSIGDEYHTLEEVETSDNESSNLTDRDEDLDFTEAPEFSTNTTPSLDNIEELFNENNIEISSVSNSEEEVFENQLSDEIMNEFEKEAEDSSNEFKEKPESAQIDELFNDTFEKEEAIDEDLIPPLNEKKSSKIIPLLGTVAIISALGYFGYTKFFNSTEIPKQVAPSSTQNSNKNIIKQEAMPIESVENIETTQKTEEAINETIPIIEQNLDTTVQVANLAVNWEVPSSYAGNTSAKRYLLKIGKIIQLNLKTEFLLLSKPPLTNKISVELKFDKLANKFVIESMPLSSGEKAIDDLIEHTVKGVLELNLKTNMSIFNNTSGNPVLVINL